ncbi:Gfo/Idh/MocA family oxidoreductase [Defluviimonas sp. SAOS-178_SWC]|uniref:Gfo/Idh/MocA family oxidoreductase n=1 Tax=Defluviimonas sp. SAOS-178_SWC TaxID=3121287 RepID=UPI003221C403
MPFRTASDIKSKKFVTQRRERRQDHHRHVSIAGTDAGKHVWCEKPMALTRDDVVDMTRAAERSGAVTLVGDNFIHNPAFRHARRLIAEAGPFRKCGASGRRTQELRRGQVRRSFRFRRPTTRRRRVR